MKAAAGAAPYALLYCPQCGSLPSSHEQDSNYPWSLQLKCTSCQPGTKWWVCRICASQRKHLTDKGKLARHNRQHPLEDTPHRNEETSISVAAPAPLSNQTSNQAPVTQSKFPHLHRPQSHNFFRSASIGNGQFYLIANAVGMGSNLSDIHLDDIDMMWTLSQLVNSLTRNQRELLADVLSKTTKVTSRQAHEEFQFKVTGKTPNKRIIPVPLTKQQLRSAICEGQRSLITNLPHPEVYSCGDHAYVLPSECVADLLAHDYQTQGTKPTLHPVQSLVESKLAKEITARNNQFDCLSVFLCLWSDDFEPNYAKGNRGSVWIITLTIQTAKWPTPSSLETVYPIAAGPKGSDHQDVLRILMADITKLARQPGQDSNIFMYDGSSKEDIKISAHLLCITQDQPERRGFCGLLCGGLGYHARWGWSFSVSRMKQKMVPCTSCYNKMFKFLGGESPSVSSCSECFNFWDQPQTMCHEPDDEFPITELDKDTAATAPMLQCTQLNFTELKEKVNLTHQKIVSGEWSSATSKAYLSRYCINSASQTGIIKCGTNCKTRERVIAEGNPALVSALEFLIEATPADYQQWQYPAIWESNLNLQQFTEPCMHLLFLGCCKSMVFEYQKWARLSNKFSALRRGLLEATQEIENLHIGWCKVQPYKGDKLGGWVSENFLGFARIAPWAYSGLSDLIEDEIIYAPNNTISKWTIDQCKGFLRQRQLSTSGKVNELRKRVSDNKNSPIPEPLGGGVECVQTAIQCHWMMNSYLMGMTEVEEDSNQIKTMECLIRIFLTAVASLDSYLLPHEKKRKEPIWVGQYNYSCLLNLPEQTKLLGPLRNRWEGGVRGEGFLRVVKPMIQSGRMNWQKNIILNILRQKTLIRMRNIPSNIEDIESEEDSDSETEVQHHEPQSFVQYATILGISEAWNRHQVLSAVMVNEEVYCCFRFCAKPLLIKMVAEVDSGVSFCGMWYHRIHPDSNDPDNCTLELSEVVVTGYALLLPLKKKPITGNEFYTLISSNWMTWNQKRIVTQPRSYFEKQSVNP